MLKSHAPSRIASRSLKRQKSSASGTENENSTASASGTAVARGFAVTGGPAVEGRSYTRPAAKVSIDRERQKQLSIGWRGQSVENKTILRAACTPTASTWRRSKVVETTRGSNATASTSAGLFRRTKSRERKQAAGTPAADSGEIEWRVRPRSTKPPTPRPLPPTVAQTNTSSKPHSISNSTTSTTHKARSRGRSRSPHKEHALPTAVAEEEAEGGGEEELPPCPYPGHKNVSWTCRVCGGKHHLTSRSAMEPLQRVHGFKVQRVPNDGDCFFSAIKAALPGGAPVERARGIVSESEADGAGARATTGRPTKGGELTVGEMREWVAEEMGQEQLDFYILQALANPEDRWLDFVRPLKDRRLSDDEEGGEEEAADDSYSDDTEGESSQSQFQNSPETAATSHKPVSPSRPSRTVAPRRRQTENNSSEGGGGGAGGRGKEKGKDRHRGRKQSTSRSSRGDEDEDAEDDDGVTGTALVSSSASSDRSARRLGRRLNGGRGLLLATELAAAGAAATTVSTSKRNAKSKPSASSSSQRKATPVPGRTSERGSTLRERRKAGGWRVGETGGEEQEEGGREGAEADDKDNGLPVVQTVEELRRFVRLEGSVVGHSSCMWADTHAHHVVSRRLGITILFIDMEREKSAWPYRVLARTMTKNDNEEDERFVVLKREPSHFVLIRTLPSPDDIQGVASSHGGGGDGGDAAKTKRRSGGGKACFSRSELPDVVRRLWQL